MVKQEFEPLIMALRIRSLPTIQLLRALKKMPTDAIFPSSFFHRVKTEQNSLEAAQDEFCDGLLHTRNNDVLAWLLVAAEMTKQTELVDFILDRFREMFEETDECQRIENLYREKVEFVRLLWDQLSTTNVKKSAVKFYGDWPDHMGLDRVFLRHEVNELTDRIKNLLLGPPGALVIYGTGGLGKTTTIVFMLKQLMLTALPTKHCGYVKRVFWLNVCNLTMAETFNESDFLDIVYNLLVECEIVPANCSKTANGLKVQLDKLEEKLLFVIDDVFNIGVTRIMSKLGDNIRVLALTRNKMKALYKNDSFYSEAYELPVMADETIQSMLTDFYHLSLKPWLNVDGERKMKRLAEVCLGLPLAASVVNQSFVRLESPREIEKTYWLLLKNFEKLALTGVAVDKLGNSQNAVMTVHSLLTYNPDFDKLADDVLSAFLLFGPGDTVAGIDLQILWGFQDFGQVKQHCQPAVDASLLRMTADDGFILHDLLHFATFKHLKNSYDVEDPLDVKRNIIQKSMLTGINPLACAILEDRPNLLRNYHDFGDTDTIVRQCTDDDLKVLKMLLEKVNVGKYWLKSAGSPNESSVSSEMFCRFLEKCLSNESNDVLKPLAEPIRLTLIGKRKWYQNLLFVAIKFKCTKVVTRIMQNDILKAHAVECRDVDNNTALIFAAMNACDLQILKLLASQIDGNLQNSRGETVLHYVALNIQFPKEKVETVCSLSPHPINVDIQDAEGRTALHYAVWFGKFDVAVYLVEAHKANVSLRNSNGNNSIELAIGAGNHYKIGKWLLNRSDVIMSQYWYDEAIKKSPADVKSILLIKKSRLLQTVQQTQDVPIRGGKTNQAHLAAVRNDLDSLVKLRQGMSNFRDIICALNEDGRTVLTEACFHENRELIEFILEYGCVEMIDHCENNGFTALMTASQEGNKAVVELLLNRGANIDLPKQDGATALYIASQNGHLPVVELLLNRGANGDLQANDGATALYIASQNGHLPVVELLLNRGANVDLQANNGWTALHIASESGHLPVVELLLNRGANGDLQTNNGATALHIASQNGHLPVVELLLNRGANVDLQKNDGATALHHACVKGYVEIINLLLDRGALIDQQAHNGWSALHYAHFHGQQRVVELLTSQGANCSIKDNNGCNACEMSNKNS